MTSRIDLLLQNPFAQSVRWVCTLKLSVSLGSFVRYIVAGLAGLLGALSTHPAWLRVLRLISWMCQTWMS